MNRTLWVHQFDQVPSLDVPGLAAEQGFNRVAVKALDGQTYMAAYDTSSDAIAGLDSIASWRDAFASKDIILDVWVNVLRDGLDASVPLWQAILERFPFSDTRLIFDLEPYRGFWGSLSSLASFRRAIDRFPSERLGIGYDVRDNDWSLGARLLVRYWMPQLYNVVWLDQVVEASGYLLEPVLSTAQSVAEWRQILRSRLGERAGLSGYGVFRAPLSQEQANYVHQSD